MTLPRNPYVAGNPVGDSPAFIGRADVLREVARVLRRPQDNAIVLYGQRRIGKTSILQHLVARLPAEGSYHPVYFDLQDKAAWPLGRVLQDLACAIAHSLGQPDPDLGDDPETAFRDEWLPTVLNDLPADCSLVLLFDEFDVLTDPRKKKAEAAFFPYLRGLLASDPARIQFVFVIGRNVYDLDTIARSLFKGTPYQRVSLLNRKDTAELVRLSQANDTLVWPDDAVTRVWQLTHGHPFLTQQICSHVWERAYDEDPQEPPTVSPADVDAAVPDALEASRNTMEWLWDGLGPAERVVTSALAESGPNPITQDKLEHLLRESGVRVLIRELQNAPQILQEWDLIEPTDGGYRFRVELLRRWIAEHKPLSRVQEELDRVEPVAESFYQAALGLYRGEELEQAIPPLQQAIRLNPNHVGAYQLLADILLAQGQENEAKQLLERLYEIQPAAARPRLVQALLALAQDAEGDAERLTIYDRVLELDPAQPEARAGRQRIWQQRGDTALAGGDLGAALRAYQTAGLADKVTEVEQEIRRRDLAARRQEMEGLEQKGRYRDALDLAHDLSETYPDEVDWAPILERLDRKTQLTSLYQRAQEALRGGDRHTARTLLAQVVALEPGYEEATRYLHLAVAGVDVVSVQSQLETEEKAHQEANATIKRLQSRLDDKDQEISRLWLLIGASLVVLSLGICLLGLGWLTPLGQSLIASLLRDTPTPTPSATVSPTAPSPTSVPEFDIAVTFRAEQSSIADGQEAIIGVGHRVAVEVTSTETLELSDVELWWSGAGVESKTSFLEHLSGTDIYTFLWEPKPDMKGPYAFSVQAVSGARRSVREDIDLTVYVVERPTPKPATPQTPTATPTGTPTPTPTGTLPPTSTRTPTGTPTPTVKPGPPTGRIVFSMIKPTTGHWGIYMVNADGTELREVLEQARQPCFSPNGRQLVVNGERPDQQNLLVMDVSGGNVQEVSQDQDDARPSWSLDGRTLAFDNTGLLGDYQLYVLTDLVTRTYRVLRSGPNATDNVIGSYPTWLPDDRIVYQGVDYWDTNERPGLYVVSSAGGLPTRVTSHAQDTAPAVYGTRVAFMSQRQPGGWQIFVADVSPDGPDTGLKQLTTGEAHSGLPAWSPDGQWIAFVSNEGGSWGIWAMRPDGSERQRIVDLGPQVLDATWVGERISWAR